MAQVVRITVTVEAESAEHPVEQDDLPRALAAITPLLKAGATAGTVRFDVPHSHMGEEDHAWYRVAFSVDDMGEPPPEVMARYQRITEGS